MAITLTDNDFFTGLTNLAVFMRLYATNTSRTPDNFVESFATETLEYGDTKIFPFSNLPAVGDYSATSSLLTTTVVDTNEETIKINQKKLIKSSYNGYMLEMAFTSGEGLNQFVGYIIGQMESAKTKFLYNYIINKLFAKQFSGTGQNVDITMIDRATLTPEQINEADLIDAKNISKQLQTICDNVRVYTDKYNGKGYDQALELSDMKFVWCAPYKYNQVVDLYGTLLNSSVISNSFDKPTFYTIPEISIPASDTTIGFLMHKYAYQFFYKFVFMGSFFDVSNVTINNFLHFWFGDGWLDNLPVVKFKAVASA